MANLTRIPVDTSALALIVASEARPAPVYENGEALEGRQAANDDGVPLWSVELAAFAPQDLGGGLVTLRVKFPSATAPALPIQTPVIVTGLVAGVMRTGSLYFSASGLVAATTTQGKRPE